MSKIGSRLYLIAAILITNSFNSKGQVIIIDTLRPSFEWVIPLVDLPFMKDAAQTEANYGSGGDMGTTADIKTGDYKYFYRNLSMSQNTEMTRNLHGTFYYGSNLLWYKLLKPTNNRRYFLNRVFANITSAGLDFLLIKIPYGFAYQHEEFHRSVMSTRGIYSYDEVWKFGKGFDIAVTHVKDEDLIALKANHPADLVRLAAAGVEAEYAYLQRIREDNFFRSANLPNIGITILGTIHAVSYVNLPFATRFNDITDSILSYDRTNISARDFTGYDFSAWIYDLVRPDEPYEDRGSWPDGIGIKRPVKESDLTPEMKDFLRETGNMQYLNFVTPFIFGINKLRINDNFHFNFALRSIPTSFGYYAGGDFYIEKNKRSMLFSIGVNKSKNLVLPDLALKYFDVKLPANDRLSADFAISCWLQPKDQRFYADKSRAGLLLKVVPGFSLNDHFRLFSELEYKTKGWLFGNPYLDEKFNFRLGLAVRTN